MYTLVKSVALARSYAAQWEDKDFSASLVSNIFTYYSRAYLVLRSNVIEGDIYVDLWAYRAEYAAYPGTLTELVASWGQRTLQTVAALPTTAMKYVRYSDAFMAGYSVEPTVAGLVLPANYPQADKKDLVITRPKYPTDMRLVDDYCLVTVNGLHHRTDASTDKECFVYSGGETLRRSNNNHLGLHSFYEIGRLQKQSINLQTLRRTNADETLYTKLSFDTDLDLENKSYILSLGGYLIWPENGVFWRSGQKTFNLSIKATPYLERYMESRNNIDFSSFNLTPSSIGEGVVNAAELLDDTRIRAYMGLSQTFLIVVDVQQLLLERHHIRRSNLPGMFTAYQEPTYPLFVGYGKTAEYWKVREGEHWSVTVQDSFLRNYVLSNQQPGTLGAVTDQLVSYQPYHPGRAYLLEIAGYSIGL